MPQWTVEGADKTSGKDISILVEAPDKRRAHEVASAQNILVSGVTPSAEKTVAAPTLAYRAPSASSESFRPMHRAARICHILAIVYFATALLYIIADLFFTVQRIRQGYDAPSGVPSHIATTFIWGALIASAGAACEAGASLLHAYREVLLRRTKD